MASIKYTKMHDDEHEDWSFHGCWAEGNKFNGNNCPTGIRRQLCGYVGGNELINPFRVPERLKLPVDFYCSFLKNLFAL